MTHTLLTGASGWFGAATLRLLEEGVFAPGLLLPSSQPRPPARLSVVLGSSADSHLRSRWAAHADVYVGDLTDPVFVASLPRPDRLLHAAACIHPRQRLPRLRRGLHPGFAGNVAMLAQLLDHIGPTSPVLLISSVAVLHADLGYARSKQECEALLRAQSDRPSAICRAAWFAGPAAPPRQRSFDRLAARGWFPSFRPSPRRSVSFVDDVVRASVAAFDLAAFPPPVFSVASAPVSTFDEILSLRRATPRPQRLKLPSWLGAVLFSLDRFVLARGGYIQYLHVLAEVSRDWSFDDSLVLASRDLLALGSPLPPDSVVWLERNR